MDKWGGAGPDLSAVIRAEVGSTSAWPKAARLSRLFRGKELRAHTLPTFKLARLLLETRGMGLLNTLTHCISLTGEIYPTDNQ